MKIDVPWLFLSESVACFFTPLYQLFTYYLRKECPRTNFLSLVFEKTGSKSCKALKFLRKKVFKLYIFIPTLPPLHNCQRNKTTAQLSCENYYSIFSLQFGKVKHELRVQIHELRVQNHELRVQIFELRVQIHKLGY